MPSDEDQGNYGLIHANTGGLIRRMDQRLDLVSRLIQEIEEKNKENKTLELSNEWFEPEVLEVKLEKNDVFWGTVEKCEGKILIKNQKEGFASAIIHIVAAAAMDNLSNSEKFTFNKWAGLTAHQWDQSHYSEFAFAFVKWLSIPNAFFDQSEAFSKSQGWLAESGAESWETNEFSDDVTSVFMNMFKKLPF